MIPNGTTHNNLWCGNILGNISTTRTKRTQRGKDMHFQLSDARGLVLFQFVHSGFALSDAREWNVDKVRPARKLQTKRTRLNTEHVRRFPSSTDRVLRFDLLTNFKVRCCGT